MTRPTTSRAARLQQVLEEFVLIRGVPGATAAIVDRYGETWAGASGVADPDASRPMTPDTQMAIGSMTKSFVAVVMLLLVERGRLALDDPIARYLSPDADAHGANIHEVLAHRSGIGEHVTPRFVAALLGDCSRAWTPSEVLRYQEAPRRRGEYAYSSTNYILAGLAIERLTCTSVATAMTELLLEPLGLDRIVYQGVQRPPAPVAFGVTQLSHPTPETLRDASGLLPCRAVATAAGAAGGMAADAGSLARWVHILHSGRVLQSQSLSLLTESDGHGFGSAAFDVAGIEAHGHPGRIPGYRGIFAYLAALETSCAALINTDEPEAEPAELMAQLIGVLESLGEVR